MRFEIGGELCGLSVRELLTSHLELSRRAICSLKNNERGIVLNGNRVTVRAVLSEGDVLELALEEENKDRDVAAVDIPIDVIYEDDAVTVVNKPPFMPTIISHGHHTDTLANALMFRYRDREFVMRAVNRLDRDTSGICLIANSRRSAHILGEQMKNRRIEKKYLAILDGTLKGEIGEQIIKNKIRRKEGSAMLREVTDAEGALPAETAYRLFACGERYSAVIAMPKTGRTHQLRVHFSHIGHPIVGDSMYGSSSEFISRQALHAFEITFTHPYTKEIMTFRASLPQDIINVAEQDNIDLSQLS